MTVYVDPEVARATRVRAARTDRRDSDIVEDALRSHLGIAALDDAQVIEQLDADQAIKLAYDELRAHRADRS